MNLWNFTICECEIVLPSRTICLKRYLSDVHHYFGSEVFLVSPSQANILYSLAKQWRTHRSSSRWTRPTSVHGSSRMVVELRELEAPTSKVQIRHIRCETCWGTVWSKTVFVFRLLLFLFDLLSSSSILPADYKFVKAYCSNCIGLLWFYAFNCFCLEQLTWHSNHDVKTCDNFKRLNTKLSL